MSYQVIIFLLKIILYRECIYSAVCRKTSSWKPTPLLTGAELPRTHLFTIKMYALIRTSGLILFVKTEYLGGLAVGIIGGLFKMHKNRSLALWRSSQNLIWHQLELRYINIASCCLENIHHKRLHAECTLPVAGCCFFFLRIASEEDVAFICFASREYVRLAEGSIQVVSSLSWQSLIACSSQTPIYITKMNI